MDTIVVAQFLEYYRPLPVLSALRTGQKTYFVTWTSHPAASWWTPLPHFIRIHLLVHICKYIYAVLLRLSTFLACNLPKLVFITRYGSRMEALPESVAT